MVMYGRKRNAELKNDIQLFALIMEDQEKKHDLQLGTAEYYRTMGLHYQYAGRGEDEERLLMGGPCEISSLGEGNASKAIWIIKATSLEDAQKFADCEPMKALGYRKIRVLPWTVQFGTMEASLRDTIVHPDHVPDKRDPLRVDAVSDSGKTAPETHPAAPDPAASSV
jgi:uncharacterized protein YciI